MNEIFIFDTQTLLRSLVQQQVIMQICLKICLAAQPQWTLWNRDIIIIALNLMYIQLLFSYKDTSITCLELHSHFERHQQTMLGNKQERWKYGVRMINNFCLKVQCNRRLLCKLAATHFCRNGLFVIVIFCNWISL